MATRLTTSRSWPLSAVVVAFTRSLDGWNSYIAVARQHVGIALDCNNLAFANHHSFWKLSFAACKKSHTE